MQFGVEELDSNDKSEVPAHLQKERDLPFNKKDHRVFILPPMHNYKTICQSRGLFEDIFGLFIIRHFLPFFNFLTLETGEFTGHAKATFPYLLVAKDGQMIYLPDCVL